MAEENLYVLDGGLGTELQKRSNDVEKDPLFGSSALYYNPHDVYAVHMSFLENGADIISTATYQASIRGICDFLGISEDGARTVMTKAVNVAKCACDDYWNKEKSKFPDRTKPKVVGSIGPYGAMLLDGSEYHGLYVENMTVDQIKDWHRPRIECLAKAGIDLFGFETIPSLKEGEALMELLKEFPAKAWLSFSCMDGKRTCLGEPFQDVIKKCLEHDSDKKLVAIGVNCTKPSYVSSLLQEGKTARKHVPYIVYPNSGEEWGNQKMWVVTGSPKIGTFVDEWLSLGAAYVGGCCRVTPDDIRDISQTVSKRKTPKRSFLRFGSKAK